MKRLLVLVLAALGWAALAAAQGVLPVPALTARVIDQSGTLDDVQRLGLEEKLAQFERTRGTQIVVLMVPTTQPEDIASYANRVANSWKIGRRQVGDGVLVVVAKDDRKVRIEVAKTLEGAVPDLAARQIIETAITPRFRAGDFAGGLRDALDQLIARINGEALPLPQHGQPQRNAGGAGFDWFDSAIFLFFAVPVGGAVLRGLFGRRLGAMLTGGGVGALAWVFTQSIAVAAVAAVVALLFAMLSGGMGGLSGRRRGGWGGPVVLPGGGWSGGSSVGGGGGWSSGGGGDSGFSSGGGGDFGGGGASGDW